MTTTWSNGDVDGGQTLTDNDHLYPAHINELRTAVNTVEGNRVTYVAPVGSTSDWTTDVTNIQAAIDTSEEVILGEGTFYLSGKNGSNPYYIFNCSSAIKFTGQGLVKTQLRIKSDVDSVTDIFLIAPTAATEGYQFRDFAVIPYSTVCARHAFHVNLTSCAEGGASKFIMENVYFGSASPGYFGGAWNGYDFYLTNPSLANGFYLSRFSDCMFNNGLYFNRLGDSNRIERCYFGGVNRGCTVASMATAGGGSSSMFTVDNCNAYIRNGVLKLTGTRFKITNNNFETVTGDGVTTPTAVVEINGSDLATGLADFCTVNDNLMTVASLDCHALYIQNAVGTTINRNYLVGGRMGAASRDLYLDTGADYTYIGMEQAHAPDGFNYTDAGTNTQWSLSSKVYTPPVLATGAGKTVDEVITALQSIGLVTQS